VHRRTVTIAFSTLASEIRRVRSPGLRAGWRREAPPAREARAVHEVATLRSRRVGTRSFARGRRTD
jgi:hypothetical protein